MIAKYLPLLTLLVFSWTVLYAISKLYIQRSEYQKKLAWLIGLIIVLGIASVVCK